MLASRASLGLFGALVVGALACGQDRSPFPDAVPTAGQSGTGAQTSVGGGMTGAGGAVGVDGGDQTAGTGGQMTGAAGETTGAGAAGMTKAARS